jgi:YVTN family beta-propeller protein
MLSARNAGRAIQVCSLLSLLMGCGSRNEPSPAAAPRDPETSRSAQAEAVQPHRIYSTNEMSGDMTVIDGQTLRVLATIPLGKRPRGIQLSPDDQRLFVALSGTPIAGPGVDRSSVPPADPSADGIGAFDLGTQSLTRVIRGVSDPEQLVVSPDGRRLYIASEDTGTAVILDVDNGKTLASLAVGGEPKGVGISPDGRWVYVTSEETSPGRSHRHEQQPGREAVGGRSAAASSRVLARRRPRLRDGRER